jgi:hypothetical protein
MDRLRATLGRCTRLVWLGCGAVALLGCGAEFDPQSELSGLRVLAVKKSLPYARPGETVDLRLLWHDTDSSRPPPQIAWLASCENPAGDLFQLCFTQPPRLTGDALAARFSMPTPGSLQANDSFSFATSPDLISSRPQSADQTMTPYGLTFVFFAACAGELGVRTDTLEFPFVCYEEQDGETGFSAGDQQLDSTRFVVGYSQVFAYDSLTNENPIVHGIQFDGMTLLPEGSSLADAPADAVYLPSTDLCIGDECVPPSGDPDPEVCPDELTIDHCEGDCNQYSVRPLADRASAEVDSAASLGKVEVLGEQMWVNYYAAGGEMDQEVRLLNDATRGWFDEYETDYEPPREPTVSYIWAVAHDNRGGAEWARLRVCVR